MKASLNYIIVFGPDHTSDPFAWDIELTEEESAIYQAAVSRGEDLNEIPELKPALERAYDEIWDHEAAVCKRLGEENALERGCQLKVHFTEL